MVKVSLYGKEANKLQFCKVEEKGMNVAKMIESKSGLGNDFLGWMDYESKLTEEEIVKIEKTAKRIRKNFDCLVVCGIGGSFLGAKAIIEAINGMYSSDDFEIIFFGNTLSPDYSSQVLHHLENKKFAVNVISKSGTTTETAVAFRLLKNLIIKKYGREALKDSIIATTDKARGALKQESLIEGYETFVIPDNVGGRFSVITPVGLLPIAVANINIREFINGVRDGEKEYSVLDYKNNPAYMYGMMRYLLHTTESKYPAEMFITYNPQYNSIGEWFKQLFDESEGKDLKAMLCSTATFTTDLHSLGQFIQEGTPLLYETILDVKQPHEDVVLQDDEKNLDNLNYLSGKTLSYINDKAYKATLDAHTKEHTSAVVLEIDKMDAYSIGNLMYFFFRACAYSAYLLEVNPFNQPGVEVYKKKMFHLLGKPGYEKEM